MLSDRIIDNYIITGINRGYTINYIKEELNKRGISDNYIFKRMNEISKEKSYYNTTTSINYTINKFILWLYKQNWQESNTNIQDKNNLNNVLICEKKIKRKKWLISISYILNTNEKTIDKITADFKYLCEKYKKYNIINIIIFSILPIEINQNLLNQKLDLKTLTNGMKTSIVIDLNTRKIITKPVVFPIYYSKEIIKIRNEIKNDLMLKIDLTEEEETYRKIKTVRLIRSVTITIFIIILVIIIIYIYLRVKNISITNFINQIIT